MLRCWKAIMDTDGFLIANFAISYAEGTECHLEAKRKFWAVPNTAFSAGVR
jgi:hypothetical protein